MHQFKLEGKIVFYGAGLGKAAQNEILHKISDYLVVQKWSRLPTLNESLKPQPNLLFAFEERLAQFLQIELFKSLDSWGNRRPAIALWEHQPMQLLLIVSSAPGDKSDINNNSLKWRSDLL